MDKEQNKTSNILKKFWNFIWHGDSWLSWITFIIVIFIFIKFIFFPALALVTGTQLPIVIVESCSMYHDREFSKWWGFNRDWYDKHDITEDNFSQFSLENGFAKGDIFFVTGVKINEVKLGDVIIFTSGDAKRAIIHRVVSSNPVQTKGDNNPSQFSLEMNERSNPERIDETNIQKDQIVGKVVPLKIPYLGWAKLIFFEPLRQREERGVCR